MKLGMPTLIERETLCKNAKLCAALGLDFLEINMNLPSFLPGALDAEEILSLGQRYGIGFTIHLDENMNPFDFNPLVAQAYGETAAQAIDLSKRAGISRLVMHMPTGVYFTLPGRRVYLFERYSAVYLEHVERFREFCDARIGNADILICIENTSGFMDAGKAGIERLLTSPRFALTLDTGHAHACDYADADFYRKHDARIAHMHLHDARGRNDHLPPGEGDADVCGFFDFSKARGLGCVLETKTEEALTRAADWARARGK